MAIGRRACASLAEDKTKTQSEHMFEEIAHICMWEYEASLCVKVCVDVYADQQPRLS